MFWTFKLSFDVWIFLAWQLYGLLFKRIGQVFSQPFGHPAYFAKIQWRSNSFTTLFNRPTHSSHPKPVCPGVIMPRGQIRPWTRIQRSPWLSTEPGSSSARRCSRRSRTRCSAECFLPTSNFTQIQSNLMTFTALFTGVAVKYVALLF